MTTPDLQDIHNALPAGHTIVDQTIYRQGRMGSRTINVTTDEGGVATYLGHFAEYPTAATRWIFTPEGGIAYRYLVDLLDALSPMVGVHVESPSEGEGTE